MEIEDLKKRIAYLEKQLAEKEEKLQEKDHIFQFIMESNLSGYWDWHIQDDYEYMSPTFKKMFGYEDHEMENKPQSWQNIIHPEDLASVFEVFDEHVASKGQKPYYNTVRYFHKDGSIIWVHCCGQIIEWDQEGKPIRMIGSHINITPLKNIEKQLTSNNKALNEANDSLAEFTNIVCHDLKEPLRGVENHCQFLLEDFVLQEEAVTKIKRVIYLAQYSKDLLNDLLSYSRLGLQAKAQKVNLHDVVSKLQKTFLYTSENTDIKIIHELPTIISDESLITQVFHNLIANGIKYNHSDKKCITVGVIDNNTFFVEDNGIGIRERHYTKAFQIFQRLNKKSDFPEGTGVGLTFVKKIIKKHNGSIYIESKYGEGSKFVFTLNDLAATT